MKKRFFIFLCSLLIFAFSCSDDGKNNLLYQYHSPEEIEAFLDEVVLKYPNITSLDTVGYSQEGRAIRALIISDRDYPSSTLPDPEPRVRFVGAIHGNEKISAEILIRLIEYLTYNYGKDPNITDIIDHRYIVIIPVLNPDGLASDRRYNSRGVDLNRNFSIEWMSGTTSGSYPFSEIETSSFRDYSLNKIFHLSLTFHGGAVLVNTPFDYDSATNGITPIENDLVRFYAKGYTTSGIFLTNPDLSQYSKMEDGIINGGDWYIAKGTLQDWSYKEAGRLDLTVEIARRNPSKEKEVQQVFLYNRDCIINYIKMAGYGVYGYVKKGGSPLAGVKITVYYEGGLI
ncbi:MAG: DUF2817 domain-containing protein, partial [Spirochaetes bacterium]|nr:DUF2817 domain-containing protein [Spirochaetota bacterium]